MVPCYYIVERLGAPSNSDRWVAHTYIFTKCFKDEVVTGGYSNVLPGSALSRQYGKKGKWFTKRRGYA